MQTRRSFEQFPPIPSAACSIELAFPVLFSLIKCSHVHKVVKGDKKKNSEINVVYPGALLQTT